MTVIINELLCYMLCKIDSVPIDVLVKLISENFSDDEVETTFSVTTLMSQSGLETGVARIKRN